jgi:hypothetical protein
VGETQAHAERHSQNELPENNEAQRMTPFEPMSLAEMDAHAKEAAEELKKLNQASVEEVAAWWYNWYLRAGHKRLGRLLVKIAKDERMHQP